MEKERVEEIMKGKLLRRNKIISLENKSIFALIIKYQHRTLKSYQLSFQVFEFFPIVLWF